MKREKILLSALLVLLTIGLMAQDKFEYAVVTYTNYNTHSNSKYMIRSTVSGEDKIVSDGVLTGDMAIFYCFAPATKYLTELGQQGWEIINTDYVSTGMGLFHNFYLKRKKS